MTTQTVGRSSRRTALIGFVVGFVMAFVVTVLALMFRLIENLEDVLVPGVVYATAFVLVVAVVGGVRRAGRGG